MREYLFIGKEIFKNFAMGNRSLQKMRMHFSSGRTTGAMELDKAFNHCKFTFEQYKLGLEDAKLAPDYFSGKNILEIGPGANLGVGLFFMAENAKSYDALDRFPDVQATLKEKELYQKIIAHFNHNENVSSSIDLQSDVPVFKQGKLNYYGECSLENASNILQKKYDIIVSHLALEHVADIDTGIRSVAQLIKPGGICIFICNLVSLGGVYRHTTEPLRLLYYSEPLWNLMFCNRGGSNRARVNVYKQLIVQNDLKIISLKVLNEMSSEDLMKIKRKFHKKFSRLSDEELRVLKFRIVAQQ